MKSLWTFGYLLLLNILSTTLAQSKEQQFFNDADSFFKNFVVNGLVNYSSIKDNPAELNNLLRQIEKFNLATIQSVDEKKAFLINAYNLLVISSVIKNYPLRSVLDLGGFFDRNEVKFAGESITLDELEKKRIFGEFNDPRLHFILVCAAIGCPKIINKAYTPENVGELIQDRTSLTLNNDYYVLIDKSNGTVLISELFKWYKKDFTENGQTVIQYINQFRSEPIPENYSIDYITYDWRLNYYIENAAEQLLLESENLQAYTPSTLLKPGQYEIKIFNNLYTQTAFFDGDGNKQNQISRSTFFTAITNFLYGITPTFNIGFDLYFRSVRNDGASSSPFSLFNFSSNSNSRSALSQIGPKIKISPFNSLRNLAFQAAFLIPLNSDLDGSENNSTPYLDVDGTQLWTQLFYDVPFEKDFLAYFESGVLFRFGSDFEDFYVPLKAIVNYYPSDKFTVYVPAEFTSFWDGSSLSAYYSQLGIGGKYQLTSNIELEALVTKFLFGKSQGAGQTYNIGFRFIR